MILRPATNPEISFEISDEGEVLSYSISPKLQNNLNINEVSNMQELYDQLVALNNKLVDNDYV